MSIRIVSKTAKQLDVIIHWRKPVVTEKEPQTGNGTLSVSIRENQ
ncbi:MAG TPA: hypothetical protein PLD62_10495 [Candidatus Cloacimonadota bacterium]|nr:hypothetical protein [Candidatus Cloacimonadota bacterium]